MISSAIKKGRSCCLWCVLVAVGDLGDLVQVWEPVVVAVNPPVNVVGMRIAADVRVYHSFEVSSSCETSFPAVSVDDEDSVPVDIQ